MEDQSLILLRTRLSTHSPVLPGLKHRTGISPRPGAQELFGCVCLNKEPVPAAGQGSTDLLLLFSTQGGVAALEMGLTSLTSPELNQFFSTAICFLGISLIFKLTFLPGITFKVQIILIKYLLAGAPSILPR